MMKKITLIAAVFAAFSMNAQIFSDSFEDYEDFAFETIGDWTQIDNDGNSTYGSSGFNFANENYTGTGIVFNPSMATADPDDGTTAADTEAWPARTGDKGLYMIAATSNPNGTAANDDYFISPQISLAGVSDGTLTFWAKSLTEDFGAERLEVLLSTSGNAEEDFTENLSDGVITVPEGEYTELSYDLSAYAGEDVYIAIHYLGLDSFVLQIDDFVVDGTLGTDDINTNGFAHFLNSNAQLNLRANVALENVQLFNIIGQEVMNKSLSATNETVSLSALTDGVYIARVNIAGTVETFKIIKK